MKISTSLRVFFSAFILTVFTFGSSFAGEVESNDLLPVDEIVIPEILLDAAGDKIPSAELEKKFVGLYFSASWCGPCRKFTPKLIEFRNKYAEEFEVILVGGDGSKKAQANYMKKYAMPWLAMKNQSVEAKHASKVSGVEYIPFLVILDKKGNIITKNGKSDLSKLGDKAFEYWKDL